MTRVALPAQVPQKSKDKSKTYWNTVASAMVHPEIAALMKKLGPKDGMIVVSRHETPDTAWFIYPPKDKDESRDENDKKPSW